MSYYDFCGALEKDTDQQRPRAIEQEIRRRTNVVGSFPDSEAALMLVAARLWICALTPVGTKRYMNMEPLLEREIESAI